MSNTDTPTREAKFGEPWRHSGGNFVCTHINDSVAYFMGPSFVYRGRAIACVNLLAGHDPASVVVLDRETAEEVRNILDKMYNDYETTPQDFGAAWIDEEDSNRIGKALAKLTASMGGEKV